MEHMRDTQQTKMKHKWNTYGTHTEHTTNTGHIGGTQQNTGHIRDTNKTRDITRDIHIRDIQQTRDICDIYGTQTGHNTGDIWDIYGTHNKHETYTGHTTNTGHTRDTTNTGRIWDRHMGQIRDTTGVCTMPRLNAILVGTRPTICHKHIAIPSYLFRRVHIIVRDYINNYAATVSETPTCDGH